MGAAASARASTKMRNLHPPKMKKLLHLPLLVACLVGDTSFRAIATTAPTVTESTLSNISTRAFVQTGDNVVIGGFIVIAGPNNNEIQDIIANLDGIRVRNFHSGDILNFTNLDPNGTTAQYDATTGVLSVFRYSHQVATIILPGLNANTQFLVTPNGGGSNISF